VEAAERDHASRRARNSDIGWIRKGVSCPSDNTPQHLTTKRRGFLGRGDCCGRCWELWLVVVEGTESGPRALSPSYSIGRKWRRGRDSNPRRGRAGGAVKATRGSPPLDRVNGRRFSRPVLESDPPPGPRSRCLCRWPSGSGGGGRDVRLSCVIHRVSRLGTNLWFPLGTLE